MLVFHSGLIFAARAVELEPHSDRLAAGKVTAAAIDFNACRLSLITDENVTNNLLTRDHEFEGILIFTFYIKIPTGNQGRLQSIKVFCQLPKAILLYASRYSRIA